MTNLQKVFENRSGRVIAAFRVVLAFVFLSALLLEPAARVHGGPVGELLLGGYLLVSLLALPIAWRSWWYDHRLACAFLRLDAMVLLSAVYVTEGANADFTSPFLAFFALIVLSATLRWNWRTAARAGLTVTALYIAIGLAVWWLDQPLDTYRYARRAFYMAALLLVLVWFGMQRHEPELPALALPDFSDDDEALWQILARARALTGADIGVLAWGPEEEPWIQVRSEGPQGRRTERIGPAGLPGWDEQSRDVRLFDHVRKRKLMLDQNDLPRTGPLRTPVPLAEWGNIPSGLALPLDGASGSGMLVLGGIAGPGQDHLFLGNALAREIARALDRSTLARLEHEAIVARTRNAVARDLHDSVAQSLAGACFRLEALRRSVTAATPPEPSATEREICNVRDALRREQGHVRSLIETLRLPCPSAPLHDLASDLQTTLSDAGAHWGLGAALEATGPVRVPGWLSHELQQLVREAAANAARHGKAEKIVVGITLAGERLSLHIADDGVGFDETALPGRPWSIRERVAALRGNLSVDSGPRGTRLNVTLPVTPGAGDLP